MQYSASHSWAIYGHLMIFFMGNIFGIIWEATGIGEKNHFQTTSISQVFVISAFEHGRFRLTCGIPC